MNNKKLGSSFEQELADKLYEYGFWVHLLNANKAGQPADIVAVKNKVAHLIDAKVCTNGVFPLSRVEENQDMAMTLWKECGNGEGWFAFKVADEVYMMPHYTIMICKDIQSSLSATEIKVLGKSLESWVKWVNRCK